MVWVNEPIESPFITRAERFLFPIFGLLNGKPNKDVSVWAIESLVIFSMLNKI